VDPHQLDSIKQEYHHLDSYYFNTAYFGPSPYSAKQKVARALQKELDPSFINYNTWMGISERTRQQISRLVGCSPDNITLSTSTSDIISIVANGFPFEKGDCVVAINRDYPSNILPWMLAQKNRGIQFESLELGKELIPTVKWLKEKLPANTKVFNISHVTFDTGKKVDILGIGKFCRERGILFCVDATQSLGGMPITSEELAVIDVLACSTYKWCLGPYGTAFAYFSQEAISKIQHTTGNWVVSPNSKVVTSLLEYTTETLPGARKYDRGQGSNMLANACLEAGLDIILEVGLEDIAVHNASVRDYFLENYPRKKFQLITPTDFMGNILSLKAVSSDSVTLERELKFRNIDVSVREGNVRLSFHLFNSKSQVDSLIRALDI
jgi:cysteine desulfurase / selenocysteine lyase